MKAGNRVASLVLLGLLGGLGGCATMREALAPAPSPQVALDAARIAEGIYFVTPAFNPSLLPQLVQRDQAARMAVRAWHEDATPATRAQADEAVTALATFLKTQPIF